MSETQDVCRKCEGYGAIEGKVCDCMSGEMLARDARHVAVAYNHETRRKDVFIDNDHAPKTKAQQEKESADRISAAAPQLLTALKNMLKLYRAGANDPQSRPGEYAELAEEAIAQAEGKH